MADAGYLEKVDGGVGLFVAGHASRMATVRAATNASRAMPARLVELTFACNRVLTY